MCNGRHSDKNPDDAEPLERQEFRRGSSTSQSSQATAGDNKKEMTAGDQTEE
jgi:hypothetical protein